ncbi:hypothetical protein D5b_00461 [Faustovirus]|nr:hypothetical protein D5b_00461 [Faustovirus]AMN84458.1 hypothetical protein D6_00047 [Faustovirus]AMP44400.1 hypothetical protein PRJ_Dakar_00449 [Faustovirus]QKE50155.1 hypothetical protein F-VV10_0035 [Faustovirus]
MENLKCKCTTSDGKIVVAEPATVRWCKFLSNMLADLGDLGDDYADNDESHAVVVCDYNIFNFVNQFCKFYDASPYDYVVVNEFSNDGKLLRKADIEQGRPIVRFAPLYEMAKNACKSDTKNYTKRKAAWEWFNKALDAAEYFDCEPLITEVNRSIAYILTGLDHQALQKITGIDQDEWIKAANTVLNERLNASTPKLNHTELFDAIYKTIAPPVVVPNDIAEPVRADDNDANVINDLEQLELN